MHHRHRSWNLDTSWDIHTIRGIRMPTQINFPSGPYIYPVPPCWAPLLRTDKMTSVCSGASLELFWVSPAFLVAGLRDISPVLGQRLPTNLHCGSSVSVSVVTHFDSCQSLYSPVCSSQLFRRSPTPLLLTSHERGEAEPSLYIRDIKELCIQVNR